MTSQEDRGRWQKSDANLMCLVVGLVCWLVVCLFASLLLIISRVAGFTCCSFMLSSSVGAELFRGSRGRVLGFQMNAEFSP